MNSCLYYENVFMLKMLTLNAMLMKIINYSHGSLTTNVKGMPAYLARSWKSSTSVPPLVLEVAVRYDDGVLSLARYSLFTRFVFISQCCSPGL